MAQKKLHLQGLRGIAIISVVLFHFFPQWCPNGYLGVDQFFLLSGYLMTMMLNRHKTLNLTKILDFLYRRVKRIVPLYYLTTSLILVSINLMPKSAINTNFASSINGLLFVTNLIRPLGMEDYAEKLGIAVDMFTHTWSLCLEMQFYLLFPFIYVLLRCFSENRRNYGIIILGANSYVFYLLSDNFHSFNSVFSRIWQFLAGTLVFVNLKENGGDNLIGIIDVEKQRLVEEELEENAAEKRNLKNLTRIISSFSMISTAVLLFGPHGLDPLYGRLNIILLSGLIVYLGEGAVLLENQVQVFLGEISYCWYLVHWPVIALCKMNKLTSEIELGYALSATFIISLIIHYGFEKFYLKWEKKAIAICLLILMVVNGAALLQVYNIMPKIEVAKTVQMAEISAISKNTNVFDGFHFDSDHLERLQMGYEKMTKGQRAQLNWNYDAHDTEQLFDHSCHGIHTNISQVRRCKLGKNRHVPENGRPTLLVIGNSWAQNSMGIVDSECQDVFSSIYMSATAACEPLFRTTIPGYNCSYDVAFRAAADEYKPDVLMIITRHVNTFEIVNGTNHFDDHNFNTAVGRLRKLEAVVKKKIYILDALPPPSTNVTAILNEYLKKGTAFKDSDLIDVSSRYMIAKERMLRLVQGCKKCQLFDYATQFHFSGEYKIYDPIYHVSYFTMGQHLTPAGLERVRPLVRHLCHHYQDDVAANMTNTTN